MQQKKESKEKYEEKKILDTNKNQDNKSNDQNNCEMIFEASEEAKNKTLINEDNTNGMEKELEKIKDNQSCPTDIEEKNNQNKDTTEIKSDINGQKTKDGCVQIKNSLINTDLKNEVNNTSISLENESSPK